MEKENVDHGKDQEERLFTQAEVDAIIKKRLERIKADPGESERNAALDQREQELNKRALTLDCKSYLSARGYDADLIDVISADSLDDFKSKADKLAVMISSHTRRPAPPLAETENISGSSSAADALRAAFAPGRKHAPADPNKPIQKE